jgi:hypothetical protein
MWNEFYWFSTVNMTGCRELVEAFGFHEMSVIFWSSEEIQLRKRDPGTWGQLCLATQDGRYTSVFTSSFRSHTGN